MARLSPQNNGAQLSAAAAVGNPNETTTTLPTLAVPGDIFIKTGGNDGLYICLVANSWTGPLAIVGSGGTAAGALDRVGQLDIVNDGTERDLYSFSIPAGMLTVNGSARLTIHGDYLNNSGSNQTFRLRIYFGSTLMYDDQSGGLTFLASRRAFRFDFLLTNVGATNSQFLCWEEWFSNTGTTTVGIGDASAGVLGTGLGAGYASEDSTAAKTFRVTITHSAAHANLSFRRQTGLLEVF